MSGLLPTGMATLLLADVEGSTRLWETPPEEMTSAIARLNQTVSEVIAAYGGVRPVEHLTPGTLLPRTSAESGPETAPRGAL